MLTGITGTDMHTRTWTTRRTTAGTGFALPATRDAGATTPPAVAAADPAALLPLLALQAEENETGRNRRTHDRTRAMLDALTALQSALLAGQIDPGLLGRLAVLAATPTEAGDPRLAEIADWVALRANVMLARLARG